MNSIYVQSKRTLSEIPMTRPEFSRTSSEAKVLDPVVKQMRQKDSECVARNAKIKLQAKMVPDSLRGDRKQKCIVIDLDVKIWNEGSDEPRRNTQSTNSRQARLYRPNRISITKRMIYSSFDCRNKSPIVFHPELDK